MTKKITVDYKFSGKTTQTHLYIGDPANEVSPIKFQQSVLAKMGGEIPEYIVDSFAKIHEIAKKNRVSFESVVEYVIADIKQYDWIGDLELVDEIGNPTNKK